MAALRGFAPPEQVRAVWNAAWAGTATGYRKCPSCSNKMRFVLLPGRGEDLELDACKVCQVIWFDAEELSEFSPARQRSEPSEPELPLEARRVIAEAQLQSQADQRRRERLARRAHAIGSVPLRHGPFTGASVLQTLLSLFD